MPRFAANLTMMFNEVGFLDRFEAASDAGFMAVEYLFPYDYDAGRLAELLDRHRLVQALHNLPAGDWSAGERGIACHPGREGEFQDGVGRAIEYATALGIRTNLINSGVPPAKSTKSMRPLHAVPVTSPTLRVVVAPAKLAATERSQP